MKHRSFRVWSLALCILLIAASALCTACDKSTPETPQTQNPPETSTQTTPEDTPLDFENGETVGEGARFFFFTVVDGENRTHSCKVQTDCQTVGDALLKLGFIEGEEGPYGLYVKKVLGYEADFDKNGTYWAFSINGEYAMSGVDTTPIEDGATYQLKVEKG